MTSENYVENCLRTESCDLNKVKERVCVDDTLRLLHSALGLVTEAAEFADQIKKHLFYGKTLDLVNIGEEVGDGYWYSSIAIDILKTTMNEVMTKNINKLRTRYPEKFTEEKAINRNLDAEIKTLI